MPDFAYIARNELGQRVNGTISAVSQREAVSLLSGKALFPVRVEAQQPARQWRIGRRVSGTQLATMYSQLAGLLKSGVPLLRAIDVLKRQSSNAVLVQVLDDVYHKVEDGSTLAEAMNGHKTTFGELAISMIRAGGEGGFLEDALNRIAMFTEQQDDFKSRTVGALAYPMFLAVVGFIVVFGLLVFFVPNFGQIFEQLREQGQLPMITEALMLLSETLQRWWIVGLLVGGVLFALVRMQLATEAGRCFMDAVKLRVPLLGPILKSLAVARFCRVLGTLLHNGVPILKSLDISRDAAGNRTLSAAIQDASENISAGEKLASPLQACGHFPSTVVEMIAVAEESNSLDTVLVEIADGLERRTARRLELAIRLLEPVMILIMAVIVLVVVLALLLPIFKMTSTI
jgi:general secretion pathway protein F/type IV pilus assembly protein PilC